jgi:hypothetical protein
MAYNESLADRIRKVFIDKEVSFDEKKMMGGLTFMVKFVFIDPPGTDFNKDLEYWIKLALEYNPTAKASKKKRGRL